MTQTPVVELEDARFGYSGHPIVHVTRLVIEAGEVVALVGPNGSGKSTLVKGLLGLNDHLGGTVRVLGEPLTHRRRPRLGYVPQRHTISASVRATVAEIVSVGRLAHRPWWYPLTSWTGPARRERERVAAALAQVGLADRAQADVANLSGGQQRRVLIARALAGESRALLMDEPTAGVDAASQVELAGVLADLAASGATLVIVTHEIDALKDVVTRVVEIHTGELAFDGSPAAYAEHLAEEVHPHGDGVHHDDEHETDPTPRRIDHRLVRGPADASCRTGSHRHD